MYDAVADPYCYPGTTVLKNIPGIRNQHALDRFEAISTAQRADEPVPSGRLSVTHYRAIHHHLFQDVYPWAGNFRTVRMSKGGSAFCYPEYLSREMDALFVSLRKKHFFRGRSKNKFATEAAHFLATLNAIHPFREGNGRTQMVFISLVAFRAGYPLDLRALEAPALLAAMVESFRRGERLLAREIGKMIV